VKIKPGATLRAVQRLHLDVESRAWTKVYLGVLFLFAMALFYKAMVRPQVSYTADRVALMDLREAWGQAAAGYGLRASANPRDDFVTAYRRFRDRPSVQKLIRRDPQFALVTGKANAAFSRLETAELRGQRSALLFASEFDTSLYLMDVRVDSYAKAQADTYRMVFLVVGAGLLVAIAGFAVLEFNLRASSAGVARNRAFSRALIGAQEGERLRLAYELHDTVAQDLAAVKLYCGLAEGPYAKQASLLLDRAIEEVRGICHGLRPAELDRLGIVEAVSHLCLEMTRETGIEVKLTVEGLDHLDLEQETEINLFRILQEALTNVRRHAQARHVRVVLFGFGDYIELTVDDDGCGPRGTKPGLGRTGMEERARMVGGRFHFGYGPWGGASLRVTLPTRRKEQK
jgi:signal transduction histidine kinase